MHALNAAAHTPSVTLGGIASVLHACATAVPALLPRSQSYKMTAAQKGVMVRAISPIADAAQHLKPDDVIMRFDGVQVASDGTVPFR